MDPDTGAFEPASGLTQQSRVRDDFGNWFGCDNSHLLWHFPLGDESVRRNPYVAAPNPSVHLPQGRAWNRVFPASRTDERFNDPAHVNRVTSACGLEIYRDELLGREFYGQAFTCEPVHNLVHREVLTPDGVTFRSARATNESASEFLASTDNWFRPAQVRTGPDGALWIVDMYRRVIEHPRWIPSNRLAQLDVRAGEDKGRIYRVYPRATAPRPIRNFTRLRTEELAAAMETPNGTERDIIHRELLNRGDAAAFAALGTLAQTSPRPAVRVQAWSALAGLGGLRPEMTSAALSVEKDPRVRAHLWRQQRETVAVDDSPRSHGETDMRARFQWALAAGFSKQPETVLASLLPEATTNLWMRAAVLSSSRNVASSLLPTAVTLAERTRQFALVDGLLATAVATASEPELIRLFDSLVPDSASEVTAWRFSALATFAPRLTNTTATTLSATRLAMQTLTNEQTELNTRRSALALAITRFAALSEADVWARMLQPNSLQSAMVEALSSVTDRRAAELLISAWPNFSPTNRTRILERLAARQDTAALLLTALETKAIAPAEVPVLVRSRLLDDPSSIARDRAQQLWPARASNRAKLVGDYRTAISTRADIERGASVFNNHCAACHTLGGRGSAVGPDLAPWRGKSADDFLVAILDPNAALEPRYVNYIVQTRQGGVYFGVIRSETATSIEIVSPGVHETLLRTDVAKIDASPVSLMPEGLEQAISPSEMNDLIAFLRKPAPRVFGSSTSEQMAAARKDFAQRQPNGFRRLIAATEQLEYPSWLGRLPLLHCRQSDGRGRVAWQPAAAKSSEGDSVFILAAAMGLASQPAGTFTLKVNGKAVLDFNVALDDASWQSADGSIRLHYAVMEANAEDSSGLLTISVPRVLAGATAIPTFEVVGSASQSQRWFGIYDVNRMLQEFAKP